MRWCVFSAVVFAFACSYGIRCSFNYATGGLGEAIEEITEHIEVAGQPRFEAARGTRTLEPTEEKRLRIENVAGRVEVVPGGPETVAEYVIYARGQDEADARRRAEPVEVRSAREAESGNKIWVALKQGERWPPHVSVELVVKTPPELALSVKVISADVEVMGMQGGLMLHSTSGDVGVTNSVGPVDASSTSGDVSVEDAAGRVEARTVSGDISLGNIHGEETVAASSSGRIRLAKIRSDEATVKSVSGDIDLRELEADHISAKSSSGDITLKGLRAGRIAARSSSGDISIAVARPFSGNLESHSVSGSVGLALPASSDCAVHAKTVSGSISGKAWSKIGRREASARLGAGAGLVELSTTSGNIRLDARG